MVATLPPLVLLICLPPLSFFRFKNCTVPSTAQIRAHVPVKTFAIGHECSILVVVYVKTGFWDSSKDMQTLNRQIHQLYCAPKSWLIQFEPPVKALHMTNIFLFEYSMESIEAR
jgi:hypothetical protein